MLLRWSRQECISLHIRYGKLSCDGWWLLWAVQLYFTALLDVQLASDICALKLWHTQAMPASKKAAQDTVQGVKYTVFGLSITTQLKQ